MEAHGHRLRTIFPSYDRTTLSQAICSSPGKGELSKRQFNYKKQPGFFELLATVAGQFLQNDEVIQEENNVVENKTSNNEANCLLMNTKALHNMHHKVVQQLPKDSIETSFSPQIVEGKILCKHMGRIEKDEIVNCAKLSKCNSLILPNLPIPFFIKSIMMDESTYQQSLISPSIKDESNKCLMEFKDSMLIEPNNDLKIINKTSGLVENRDCAFNTKLQLKDSNGSFVAKKLNCMEGLNGGEKFLKFNQSHDSICESCNSFYKLGINLENFKALSRSVELNRFIGDTTALSSKLDANFNTFLSSKTNIMASVDLEIVDQDQCSMDLGTTMDVETTTSNQIHLGCQNHYQESLDSLKSMSYIDSKKIEDYQNAIKENSIIQKQSKFEKKDKILGHQSSQHLFHEVMTKNLLETNTNGLRPHKITSNCNSLCELNTRSKKDGVKSIENVHAIPTKQIFFNGFVAFTRQRTSRCLPLKRKRLEDSDLYSHDILHTKTNSSMESIGYNNRIYGKPPPAVAKLRSAKVASVAPSPTTKRTMSKPSIKKIVEPHVKFGIKSFIVPEFFIDLPESANLFTLKRAVMDAAMDLLGGGLRVRVLMNGKKIIDEEATLTQTGISRSLKPESLGFMLEPSPIPTSSSTATFEDPFLVLSRPSNETTPTSQGAEVLSGPQEISLCTSNGNSICEGCSLHNEEKDPPSHCRVCKSVLDQQPIAHESSVIHTTQKRTTTTTISLRSGTTLHHQHHQDDNDDNHHKDTKSSNYINIKRSHPTTTRSNTLSADRIAPHVHSTQVATIGALVAIRAQADTNRRLRSDSVDHTPPVLNLSNNHVVHYDSSLEGRGGSHAIILHPGMEMGDPNNNMHHGLALVQKSRPLDISKRRVRRPFSVAEVEALVHAVEKLGTGRWRDVKLQAFEQAKHRTYVDLKDKWKTLVHTARIAPHQRRGEPVPQELLERVTHAHIYWTTQAAKQQAELDS